MSKKGSNTKNTGARQGAGSRRSKHIRRDDRRILCAHVPLAIARAVSQYCNGHATTIADLVTAGLARELRERGEEELSAMVADRPYRHYERACW